ncbi:MAG: hypothetical protein H7039_01395, partial [Bryobacteraceae bacterium]|nr:hypothetical protein [Bryobacteraceae bacterium]
AQPAFAEWALDENPPVAVSDTQTALPSLAPGKHQVRIFAQPGGQGESIFEIEVEAGKAPRVNSIKPAENTLGIAFTQFGEESQVTTSPEGLSIAGSEGNVIGQTGTTALLLPKLAVTTSPEYIVRGQESEWRIQTTPSEAPILSLFLRTNAPSSGGIMVRVDEENVSLRVNGAIQSSPRLARGAYTSLRGLAPGRYRIAVEREGFRADPPSAQIRVSAGKDVSLDFHLIRLSSIEIRNARPGARVMINGSEVGVIGTDGSLTSQVEPGPCRIEMRLTKYQHRPVERQCASGETLVIAGADSSMTQTFGHVHIPSVNPGEAKVVLTRQGETFNLAMGYTELPVGRYNLRASAPGYTDKVVQNLEVIPGLTNEVGAIDLKPAK